MFNWLVAGTDAHAKNYALLHVGPRTTMAPLYDLMSAALVLPEREVHHQGKLAMKLGGEYRLRGISTRHLVRAGADLGVDADWLQQTATTYAQQLPDAVGAAATGASDLINPQLRAQFVDAIAHRVGQIRTSVLISTAAPQHNQGERDEHEHEHHEHEEEGAEEEEERSRAGEVCVRPHTRNGQAIEGHHRARPGRT